MSEHWNFKSKSKLEIWSFLLVYFHQNCLLNSNQISPHNFLQILLLYPPCKTSRKNIFHKLHFMHHCCCCFLYIWFGGSLLFFPFSTLPFIVIQTEKNLRRSVFNKKNLQSTYKEKIPHRLAFYNALLYYWMKLFSSSSLHFKCTEGKPKRKKIPQGKKIEFGCFFEWWPVLSKR